MNDWNRKVIDDFRANGGKAGGPFANDDMLLLTTTGAKSGKTYTSPLVYVDLGDRIAIAASAAGSDKNPAWYHNLLAHPKATVEVGTETYEVTVTDTKGAERDQLWAKVLERYPRFAEYETKTTRTIPVLLLQR